MATIIVMVDIMTLVVFIMYYLLTSLSRVDGLILLQTISGELSESWISGGIDNYEIPEEEDGVEHRGVF